MNADNIRDQVAALLYSTGVVNDNEDITKLHFVLPKESDKVVMVDVEIEKRTEVKFIKHA